VVDPHTPQGKQTVGRLLATFKQQQQQQQQVAGPGVVPGGAGVQLQGLSNGSGDADCLSSCTCWRTCRSGGSGTEAAVCLLACLTSSSWRRGCSMSGSCTGLLASTARRPTSDTPAGGSSSSDVRRTITDQQQQQQQLQDLHLQHAGSPAISAPTEAAAAAVQPLVPGQGFVLKSLKPWHIKELNALGFAWAADEVSAAVLLRQGLMV